MGYHFKIGKRAKNLPVDSTSKLVKVKDDYILVEAPFRLDSLETDNKGNPIFTVAFILGLKLKQVQK